MANYDFQGTIENFYRVLNKTQEHRYLSWEYCYLFFQKNQNKDIAEIDLDKAALMLAFYLASWGMYRGSSFLLQYDYTIHKDLICELMKHKNLFATIGSYKYIKWEDIEVVDKFINNYYIEKRRIRGENPSETSPILRTKILMGIYGCIPAYDRFLQSGISIYKNETNDKNLTQKFGKNSYNQLCEFCSKQVPIHKPLKINKNYFYPDMKLVDMFFWEIGFENSPENRVY